MATPRVTIPELPIQAAPEDTNEIIVQDSGVTKRMTLSALVSLPSPALTAHLTDADDAHDATTISATDSGGGIDGTNVQVQLGQLATAVANGAAAVTNHIDDPTDAHDATAISATPHDAVTATTVQGQLEELATALAVKDVVWVGPDAPTDPVIEMWWDSNEASAYLPTTPVELATIAETIAGTAANKAVTPAGLDAVLYDTEPINVARYGFTRAAVLNAINAAEARGKGTIVYFPAGTYELENGISLAGKSVQLRGDGAAGTVAAPRGTVLKASLQIGPVLDYTGWLPPETFLGKTTHGGFHVIGSDVADPTKLNSGITFTQLSSATFCDISIQKTGGPCIATGMSVGNSVYLNDFERIVLHTPVSARANDVPYMVMLGANGNRFRSFGLRSTTPSADTGASGAVVFIDDGTYAPHDNLFDAWWVEYLHPPTNGTIFHCAGNSNTFRDIQWFDATKEVGATGTSHFRFVPPAVTDFGGNIVTGGIPGKGTAAENIDMGIDMRQSRNMVFGTKGYRGTNVVLAVGVGYTTVELYGMGSTGSDPAVIDNSGANTNRWYDPYDRKLRTGAQLIEDYNGVGAGTAFKELADNTKGNIWLGNAGASIRTNGISTYIGADQVLFRNIANNAAAKVFMGTLATAPSINAGAGAPAVAAAVGSIYLRTDGGAVTSLYVKESGTGTTGWVAK